MPNNGNQGILPKLCIIYAGHRIYIFLAQDLNGQEAELEGIFQHRMYTVVSGEGAQALSSPVVRGTEAHSCAVMPI